MIETFDNIKVVKSNSEILSSKIINFTINLRKMRNFLQFKDEIHYAEKLFPSILDEVEEDEKTLRNVFSSLFKSNQIQKVHNYIWTMELPYKGFFSKLDKIETLCKEYRKNFRFKPRYHVSGVGRDITMKFRILTFDTAALFQYQPKFANKLYEIIHNNEEK